MPINPNSDYVSGPFFDGRAEVALEGYFRQAQLAVAKEGKRMVDNRLKEVLKNPTGFYQSNIHVVESKDPFVSDNDVIYGPWLEGVGSRNKTTRFKGYRTFRLVTQELRKTAGDIANTVLPPWLRRMN
jgi:hypothetical protein